MSIVSDLRWICSGACGWVDSTRNLLTDSQTPITPLSRPKTGAVHLTRRGSRGGAGPPSSAKKKGRKGKERKEKEKGKEKERHKETKMS